MSIIHVIAVITSKPGMRQELLEAFNANTKAVRAEDGCIEYVATKDAEDVGPLQTKFGDDTFVVIEKWKSLPHLMAHVSSDHMKEYAAKTTSLIANRIIHVLSSA